jgi:2-dehydro-3-deoxygalactonokinase
MCEISLPEISSIPFVFIRGVKTAGDLDNTDMMRGEETELFGIWNGEAGFYVLPGSHSKLLSVDASGRIESCSTMLTGEMISALWSGTILKSAFELATATLDRKSLLQGFDYANLHGLNKALFKVRILKNLLGRSESDCYSFFLGSILQGEWSGLLAKMPSRITVGGKKQLREASVAILRERSEADVIELTDEMADAATSIGMIRIFEYQE